jgi:prophage maintenance system killer protein
MKNQLENKGEVVIYKGMNGQTAIDVRLDNETVWLTIEQMSLLFEKSRATINEHILNVFKEKELEKEEVMRKIGISDFSTKPTNLYNLDVIISVGYRVNSKRGTQFRIWATNVLRDHLVKGYTVNKKALARTTARIAELQKAIALITSVRDKKLSSDEAQGLLTIIKQYADTWTTLEAYDSGKLEKRTSSKKSVSLTFEEVRAKLDELKKELVRKGEASDLFAAEQDHGLEQLLGAVDQTFSGRELYPNIEEKAANLLYFTIKDHPFIDGNKRSGAFLFLEFLRKNKALYKNNSTIKISDTALTALALLIAEGKPREKEQVIALITHLLKD